MFKMFVFKISLSFVILTMFLVNTELVSGKRGCASFGHSCFGGHGKRSQGMEVLPQGLDSDKEINRHIPQEQDSTLNEQISNVYDLLNKPDTDIKTLLRKLIQFYEEDQRLHKKYLSRFFNY